MSKSALRKSIRASTFSESKLNKRAILSSVSIDASRATKHTPSEEEWIKDLEVDMSLLDLLLNEKKTQLGPEVLDDPKFDPILKPFELKWVFGVGVHVPVLNFTINDRKEIFYAAANVGVFYNYCTKDMSILKGHQSRIISAAHDGKGKWLVTADNGQDNLIAIWESQTRKLVLSIFNQPPPPETIVTVAISPSAKLLITITKNGSENAKINFWLWTYGRETPDDCYEFDTWPGLPKTVEFHPNNEDNIMIVFEKTVCLFTWDQTKFISPPCIPQIMAKGAGAYSDGTYVDKCHECFVSSTKGNVLIFGNTLFAKPFHDSEIDNQKILYIKNIRIAKQAITCMKSADGIIITGESNGTLRFFDKRMKLLYWFSKIITTSIVSIALKLEPRKYVLRSGGLDNNGGSNVDSSWGPHSLSSDELLDCRTKNLDEDRTEQYEILLKENVPKDASLKREPFITRNFFVSTSDGSIYSLNFPSPSGQFVTIYDSSDSTVAAIEVHEEMPYLLIAYKTGRLVLYHYETHEVVISSVLPASEVAPEEDEANWNISTIKYSKQCLHLACGKSNGELWMLQPGLLTPIYVAPFKYGNFKIMCICFSNDHLQMAYYDENMTVYGFFYDTETEDWIFKGKVRSHYKEISTMRFYHEEPYNLYSMGHDRYIIKYTEINSEEELDILARDRIEQKDLPIYFTSYPRRKYSKSSYFLIADDKHKFKTLSCKTNMCTSVFLGPAHGCFNKNPVVKMEYIPKNAQKYLVCMNKNHIGIQMLPIDGNPYRFVGCMAHPERLEDFKISADGRFVFTMGRDEQAVFMWKIKVIGVETLFQLGGEEMQPFYCLLEGGKSGFLFQEMQDLFYYMQILQQGEKVSLPRQVTDSINIGELPDLVRACGYYPSEYEIENLLTDARYREFDDTGYTRDKITFVEFVRLYINHKPANGYTIESLENAFDTLTTYNEEMPPGTIEKDDFVEAITTTGEMVSKEQLYKCLVTLMHYDMDDAPSASSEKGEREFEFLPDEIDFDSFTEDILGIDLSTVERLKDSREGDEDGDDYDYYTYYYGGGDDDD